MAKVGKFTIEIHNDDNGSVTVKKVGENIDFHTLLGALTMAVEEIKQKINTGTLSGTGEMPAHLEKEMD